MGRILASTQVQNALDDESAKCTLWGMSHARSLPALVTAIGGASILAAICRVPLATAASWVRRGSLPARYWHRLLVSEEAVAVGMTADELVGAHSAQASIEGEAA